MFTEDEELKRNGSGYYDPTAYTAIKHMEAENSVKEAARFYKLLEAIFDICELSDFRIEGRIIVRDKRTGRLWR